MGKDKHFEYKSYCWTLGTTSFRMTNFHRNVEKQIWLLSEFWELYPSLSWDNVNTQEKYYSFLKENNFVEGEINDNFEKKCKTARQKTSGLVQIGLITQQRRLTAVGDALLSMVKKNDFSADNCFNIPSDSFLYFKQILKTSYGDKEICVRPYLVLCKLLKECDDYLTFDEFTFLAPLCINEQIMDKMVVFIKKLRKAETTIDQIILDVVLPSYNYPKAKCYFLASLKEMDDFFIAGMNRKSPKYDKPYYGLYHCLKAVFLEKKSGVKELENKVKELGGRVEGFWMKLLFKKHRNNSILADIKTDVFSFDITDEDEFASLFFNYMHLFKIKQNLEDYFDLNKRYLEITDSLVFNDSKLAMTPIFDLFFNGRAKVLFDDAFTFCNLLQDNCNLDDINDLVIFNEDELVKLFNKKNNMHLTEIAEIYSFVKGEKYKQFKNLIEAKFDDSNILKLLDLFENRTKENDTKIINKIGNDADVPTIFEYIVGIIWYKISGYKGNILEYMNLSFDANLLPRTHAGGGESDIVYKYEQTEFYPKHSLLIECTLMDGTNQRRGEMEPVSRHLCNYLIDVDKSSYCTFVSNQLHPSVLSDFRMRKNNPYYRTADEYVDSMKILALSTSELKVIIHNGITYNELYTIFENSYRSVETNPTVWYKTTISDVLTASIEHH